MSYPKQSARISNLLLLLLLTFAAGSTYAQSEEGGKQRKNTCNVGFMIGPVTTYALTPNGSRFYESGIDGGPGSSFTLGFVAEQYFNRSRPRLYFSIGERL